MSERTYIAIDLKSFYASVECHERGLNPLNANLVVADTSRTEKTICLAVSPSLKAYGIPGRARLFEVIQAVERINRERSRQIHWRDFHGSSIFADELQKNPYLKLDYVAATPQMAHYIEVSSEIYSIYLKYISAEDIHVYSIDEVFIDATSYLSMYHCTAHELARRLIQAVMDETGITATAGIGTNMYLAKVAMDVVAKHIPADKDGVRIAELNEYTYRKQLWTHKPLKDFWRVGRGTAKRLEAEGIYTMGDIARCSEGNWNDYYNEKLLYRMFGVNAELLIDHAWGYEPCTIAMIKAYEPDSHSLGIGQVLSSAYSYEKGLVVLKEMADALALQLVEKHLMTDVIGIYIGFDAASLEGDESLETEEDWYGRLVPKAAHGSVELKQCTSSQKVIREAAVSIYEQKVGRKMLVRRVNITAFHTLDEKEAGNVIHAQQLDLFSSASAEKEPEVMNKEEAQKEKAVQEAILKIKEKYGKNAVLKVMDKEEGATAEERNRQIGGHKA